MIKRSLDARLERARLAVEGALNHPEILKRLSKLGYDVKKLQEGKVLIEQLTMLQDLQHDGKGEQKKATADFIQARHEIDGLYRYHLKIAKIALQADRSLWDTLQLQGQRKKRISGWLSQVQAFYNNIYRVMAQMNQRGITEAELMQVKTMIEAAAAIRIRKAYTMSEKQTATGQKKALEKKLDAWMSDFFYIAKFAMKDNMQQLEALGMVVAS